VDEPDEVAVLALRHGSGPPEYPQCPSVCNVAGGAAQSRFCESSLGHSIRAIRHPGRSKVITNTGEGWDARTKKPYNLRTVYTITDHDHFTLEWYRIGEGAADEKVVTLTHSRKLRQLWCRRAG
jgi:hypothetical protein